jgi:hypothetical protein
MVAEGGRLPFNSPNKQSRSEGSQDA